MRVAGLIAFVLLLASPAASQTIAVRVPEGEQELVDALRISDWLGWIRRNNDKLEVVAGTEARGDIEILVRRLPVDAATRELLARLPVRLDDGSLELDGTAYREASQTLAVRLPEAEKPTWVVTGHETDRLAGAAGDMAKRIPLTLERPIRVVIERDHVAQGRYLGDVGEAVLASSGAVHIVYHPDDEYAARHRIARALVARAGLSEGLPPWIEGGAALWLSGRWFGRDFEAWLPRFAAARLLPRAEQLLAAEEQADASAPLWVPAAASLVAALPGDTLRRKLAGLPGTAGVTAHLARLARLPPAAAQPAPRAALPFLRGVSFAMLNSLEGGYHAPAVDERLAHLQRLGANAASLMPFAYQPAADGPELRFMNHGPTSETDIGVLHAARRARAAGQHVLWKPHIWISGDSWPGDVAMRDEAAWTAWWDSYRRYVAHHAFLAEWAGCELFSIGVELGKTLDRQREWEELIASVRTLFSGAVTYAGNWHSDYDRAPFWDRLDFIGIDAYFPLADKDAMPAAVNEGARTVARRLRQAAERFGKPVLLTEVGYAARAHAWVEPHREGGTFSADHQAQAYRSLFKALGRPSWLSGVFVWKAFSAERGNAERPDFRFLGRPAEAVLRDYFSPPDPAAGLHTSNR